MFKASSHLKHRMNRIDKLFQEKKNNILSVYFTVGYPRLDDRVKVLESLEEHGVHMAEIGVPFSDPMAAGAIIGSKFVSPLGTEKSIDEAVEKLIAVIDPT